MATTPFPGFPAFLEAGAARIGHPEAAAPARRIAILAAMANLCAQATAAEPAHVPGILAKAAEFRDQLHAAYLAAELMLEDAAGGRGTGGVPSLDKRPKAAKPRRAARDFPPPA